VLLNLMLLRKYKTLAIPHIRREAVVRQLDLKVLALQYFNVPYTLEPHP